ncbi:MAG: hypothetical protein LQ340_005843, partial [Diploschistes diacapsis]
MSGGAFLVDNATMEVLDERRDHRKYCVKAALRSTDRGETLLATAGWDNKVFLYHLQGTFGSQCPISSLPMPLA